MLLFSRPPPSNNSTVKLKSREGEIVRPRGILTDLDDSKVSEALIANFSIDVRVHAPGCSSTLLGEEVLLFLKGKIFSRIASQIHSAVEHGPVDLVVGAFKVPVEKDMGAHIPVSNGVTSWHKLSCFSKINSKVREWLIASPAVHNLPAADVLWLAWANAGGEGLDLSQDVWILVHLLSAERAQVVQSTFFIEVWLEHEFDILLLLVVLSILHLLRMRLHWWNRPSLGLNHLVVGGVGAVHHHHVVELFLGHGLGL